MLFKNQNNGNFYGLLSAILFIIFSYHYYHLDITYYLLGAGGLSFLLSFVFPKIAFPFLYIWMVIGSILSAISSTLILGVIYFIVLLPLRFLKVQQKTKKGWIKSDPSHFKEQF